MNKKLIEVALPLDKINEASAREKSIRHGHPSTLHLWWARRPLAAARAVIWSSLVDDPSSHPELFPTEEEQDKERQRLFRLIESFVKWDNCSNDDVLEIAREEIRKANETLPILLDPFAGGGTIPLEAQRLGLEAHAHDLNPVAVMINKATIDIPFRFSGISPVNPGTQDRIDKKTFWKGTMGLSDDIRYYGEWIRSKAFEIIGECYPNITTTNCASETVIAWIWARKGKCPNPACNKDIPFVSSFVLSKKKGNEVWVEPEYTDNKIHFRIHHSVCPNEKRTNKIGRGAIFKCPFCGEITTDEYVKELGKSGKIGSSLMAIITEGSQGRLFVEPNVEQEIAANCEKPDSYPSGDISQNPRWFSPPSFGMTDFSDLFTNRQLKMLVTFSDLLNNVQEKVTNDAIKAGMKQDYIHLKDGGNGATAYGEAIRIYLAFALDRQANYSSTLNGWSGDFIIQTFGRQALPMVWDYAETNPFSNSTGNWLGAVNWIALAIEKLPAYSKGYAEQADAQSDCGLRNIMVSTDPPYYDNIGYADLSDYFYLWLKRGVKDIYPNIFNTVLVPKSEELTAIPYNFDGSKIKANEHFENGMIEAFQNINSYSSNDYPVTIFYAYKQQETVSGESGKSKVSTGWETMLTAIIKAGFSITGTWPMHTERETGLKASVNALASSIVLVCRKRPEDAPQITKKNLVNIMRKELRPALKKLQDSNIAPVDMAQSAIGPGMGVYSRYSKVLEADGSEMTVRSALQLINEEIDLYFNEQVGDLDAASRFCVDLYTQYAYNDVKYGEAEILANAKATSIPMMASHGILYAKAGIVRLLERNELPEAIDNGESNIWLLTQQLTRAMEKGGIQECAKAVFPIIGSTAEYAKDLAYRLYTIAEKKGWAQEAYAYNSLVVAWPDIQSAAAAMREEQPEQITFNF